MSVAHLAMENVSDAAGRHAPALLSELEKRERRLEEISEELLSTDGSGIDSRRSRPSS
jgi:hypothetical protein